MQKVPTYEYQMSQISQNESEMQPNIATFSVDCYL